tara:strand:+ start:172 stop:342 length:171 start_codon:yes stop_codon:yes gene_type:complete
MNLNISALLITLQHTNASYKYKYLFFYALIGIIKKNQEIEEITFKEIIKEMLLLAF